MSKEGGKKKPGLMQRLFSSKKMSVSEEPDRKELEARNKKLQRMHTVDGASLSKRTEDDVVGDDINNGVKPKVDGAAKKSPTEGAAAATQPRRPKKSAAKESATGRRKRKKGSGKGKVDTSQPLEFPCTPETVLEYHKEKPFLKPAEEWLIVELNEFECAIDSMDIIKIIAKHSKFFEVEPDELWEEFFEFVDDVPCYDEIINYDVWQEFRDKKYPL